MKKDVQKTQPNFPWRKIIDFRNVIVHEYSGVSLGRVWQVIQKDLPELKKQLLGIDSALSP